MLRKTGFQPFRIMFWFVAFGDPATAGNETLS
jgi:hypothetical protein